MAEILKLKGQYPVPLLGDGVFFQFTAASIAKLEETYGEGNAFGELERLLNNGSVKCTILCCDVGLKKFEGDKIVKHEVDWDSTDTEVPIISFASIILDAFCVSWAGKDYEAIVMEAVEQAEKIKAAEKKAIDEGGEVTDPLKVKEAFDGLRPSVKSPGSKETPSGE